MKPIIRVTTILGLLTIGVAALLGCSKDKTLAPIQHFPPVVRLTAAPIDTNVVCVPDPQRSCYSLTLNWVGYDPDGRVDHYLYAVDPPDVPAGQGDTLWITTTDSEKRLVFEAPTPSTGPDSLSILKGKHSFVVAAVDNEGLMGPRAERWFFSFTNAPVVTIQSPSGDPSGSPIQLAPALRVNWSGTDVDGVFNSKPVRYKFLLLGPDNDFPGGIDALGRPGNTGPLLRQYYAPEFDGWTQVGGDTTFVRFTNLVPGARYLFAVVAFDEAGAYSPNFSLGGNVLIFKVGFASVFGPKITMFNDFFFYAYTGASYYPGPATEVRIEVPAFQKITYNWFADPPQGAEIRSYRWMLDGDVFDTRSRTNEALDTQYWSTPSANVTTATVGPFSGGDHYFYIEAEDNTGLKSLGTIHFNAVAPTFEFPLAIVRDVRYKGDGIKPDGTLASPQGNWPGAAELDTFLFARGGYPWKLYPAGSVSSPGVLNGYAFDTLGTRRGIADLNVPLLTLGRYVKVVWLTDLESANYTNAGSSPADPQTSLRYMASPGHLNTLAAYIRQGGQAWLCGGGGGYATNISYNDLTNDATGAGYTVFSINSTKREFGPGRFMYDVAKWQSEFVSSRTSSGSIVRSLGRFRSNPGVYASLPAAMQLRNPTTGTDPVPPLRTVNSYYPSTFAVEFINEENIFQEQIIGDPIDFQIDNFDGDAPGLHSRWPASDSLNTRVDQDAVTSAGTSGATKFAMRIRTAGGGGSTGNTVTRDLGPDPRDWSGIRFMKIAVKQDQPTSAVQWRMRIIDDRGASVSTLLAVTTTGTFQAFQIPGPSFVVDSGTQPNLVHVAKLQFELVQGTAEGTTWFDNIEVTTDQQGAVLDTLMALQNSSVAGITAAAMTYYHGHDVIKPFLFSGFAPWSFRRQDCVQLFDFVFQNLWGLSRSDTPTVSAARTGGSGLRATAPARLSSGAGAAVSRSPARGSTGVGLRGAPARRSLTNEGGR